MIYINDRAKEILKEINATNTYIVSDFDRTITDGDSESSWGILSRSPIISDEYRIDRQSLYDYYHPIEIDDSLSEDEKSAKMIEWWEKHISLLIKYNVTDKMIQRLSNDKNLMKLRLGAKEFLKTLYENKIPLIIISAGIGNFIDSFLKNKRCDFNNITIVSNFLKFSNGTAVGMQEDIIHSWNKNNVIFNDKIKKVIDGRKYIILFGDTIGDTFMAASDENHQVLKIGFLNGNTKENISNFREAFDIVCSDNSSFIDILNMINL